MSCSFAARDPADCRVLKHESVRQRGDVDWETFPVEKTPSDLPADTPLAGHSNPVQATNVVGGIGRALVMRTSRDTQFGAIAERLRIRPQETDRAGRAPVRHAADRGR
jgi:Mg2+-importing ATPase